MEKCCIKYLLHLTLPNTQLGQLVLLFDKLGLYEARKKLLLKYTQQPWREHVSEVLPILLQLLVQPGPLQDLELCREALWDEECGALCELQVWAPCLLSAVCWLSTNLYGLLCKVNGHACSCRLFAVVQHYCRCCPTNNAT